MTEKIYIELKCSGCGVDLDVFVEEDKARLVPKGVLTCADCKDVEDIGDEEELDDDEQ